MDYNPNKDLFEEISLPEAESRSFGLRQIGAGGGMGGPFVADYGELNHTIIRIVKWSDGTVKCYRQIADRNE